MLITDDIFQAFLQCETKAHLKLAGVPGDHQAFPEWERHRVEAYKRHYHLHVRPDCREDECLVGVALPHDLSHSLWRYVIDCRGRPKHCNHISTSWSEARRRDRRHTILTCRCG